MATMKTTVNGGEVAVEISGHEAAVDVIRDQLGLTGTKLVCAGGVCGACTIQINGTPVASCLTPATALREAEVTTVEGLGGDSLHPVQRAFMAHDGLQCGYCTPGFVVDAADFVDQWRDEHGDVEPDRHTVADALAGHLCRCGAYEGIQRAVAAACRGDHDEASAAHPPLRVDAEAKVTGAAVYTADRKLDGMLYGVIVRSPIAAATVGAFAEGGDAHVVSLLNDDRRVRWAGQPIAALAADSLAEARRLAAAFDVAIDPLPFVTDPDGYEVEILER